MADRTNNHPPRLSSAFWRGELREPGRDPDLSGSPSVPGQILSTLNSQRSTLCLALLIIFTFGCGKKPPAAYKDFSKTNTVGVVLGEVEREYDHGLQHLYHEKDGATQPAAVRNVVCRSLNLTNYSMGYFYFKIDPTFKTRKFGKVKIEVEYLDDEEGQFGLQYDAANSPKDARKAHTFLRESVELSRSRSWQTHTFEVTDPTFKNNQNSGADFRLWVRPPKLCIRSVTVTRVR
jgi:hypothetical protein